MALDAVSLMRARVRGTPSWPGHDPETGYVGADRSDHSQKLLADGAGHTFLDAVSCRPKKPGVIFPLLSSFARKKSSLPCAIVTSSPIGAEPFSRTVQSGNSSFIAKRT